ncbi:MAG: hypothetical protein ACC661_00680, partial [Verrucomicrobiales bacterium]
MKGDHRRLLVLSEPLVLRVKVLPRGGRPANFSGIVGKVSMEVRATPTVLEVSEPMEIEMRIAGHAYPQTIRQSPFGAQTALQHGFEPLSGEQQAATRKGERIFTRKMRPRRANIPAIPSLGLSYFDPGSGEFVELFSEPIPVTVSRAATVDAFDAVFSDGSRLKNELRASRRGVHHNYVGAGVLLAARPEGWLRGRPGFWVTLMLCPPLLFGVFYLTTLRSRREKSDPEAARARR